jgi:DNA-binding transcriptional regulator YiaG
MQTRRLLLIAMSTPSQPAVQFAKRLGTVLKTLRQRQQLTQATVAELLGDGVATETVSRFERCRDAPSGCILSAGLTKRTNSLNF